MCGIFGVFSARTLTADFIEEKVKIAFAAISARGPDGRGLISEASENFSAALAHTRLSVIDLSEHGAQPMRDDLSEWCLTYNGEIYNHLEIRDELEKLDWKFHGSSDTEVLLKAWAQWGVEALPRFNGMFAFAALNRVTGELWLVRDRFGVKPLLWATLPGECLAFSSSVAAIAHISSAEVDLEYCARGVKYKAFETAGSETPFEEITAVPPGGWVRVRPIENSTLDIQSGCWYDLKKEVARKISIISTATDEDVLAECEHLLQDAVRLRLRSDVPVAVSLSGGLDSSAIAAIASRGVRGLHGFTYGLPEAASSEGPIVDEVSRTLGITAKYIWPSFHADDLNSLLERSLKFQEAPFSGLSVLAQNEVFRTVRKSGFKVLLGGQGGDEIFAGYRKFFIVAARDAIGRRDAVEAVRLIYSLGLMLLHEAGQAKIYWQALSRYGNKKSSNFKLLNWDAPAANLWGDASQSLVGRQIEDIQQWSIPSLLRYEDRNSMGHGLETRLPFMDFRLVEFALALPERLKIRNGFGKWALRKATVSLVPDIVRLSRKKRGFDVTQAWISGGIGKSLRARIKGSQNMLSPHLKSKIDLDVALSDQALSADRNLLDEALMLAWLAQPVRISLA